MSVALLSAILSIVLGVCLCRDPPPRLCLFLIFLFLTVRFIFAEELIDWAQFIRSALE